MPAVDWTTIEDAIHAWVTDSSGLDETLVRWTYEGGDRPSGMYIALEISEYRGVGRMWHVRDDAPEPDPEPGEEVRERKYGHGTATLTLQCFSGPAEKGNAAFRTLVDVMAALEQHTADLDAAGVGTGLASSVQKLEGSRASQLDPRSIATLELHFGVMTEERTTYIERVQVTVEETTTGAESETWVPDPPTP